MQCDAHVAELNETSLKTKHTVEKRFNRNIEVVVAVTRWVKYRKIQVIFVVIYMSFGTVITVNNTGMAKLIGRSRSNYRFIKKNDSQILGGSS